MVAVIVLLAVASTARAEAATQRRVSPTPPAVGAAERVVVERAPDGGYLVVWSEDDGDIGPRQRGAIFARAVDALGRPRGPVALVSRGDELAAGPAVAYDRRRREFLVAWSATPVGGLPDIHVRRLDVGGGPLDAPRRISSAAERGEAAGLPHVASHPRAGGYLVAFTSFVVGDGRYVARLQALDGLGREVGADDRALPVSGRRPTSDAVVATPRAGYVLAYSDGGGWTRRVGLRGRPVGPAHRIGGRRDFGAHLAADPRTGRLLAVYHHALGGPSALLRTRLLDARGRAISAPRPVPGSRTHIQSPAIAFDPRARRYEIAFVRVSGDDGEIWSMRLTPAGRRAGRLTQRTKMQPPADADSTRGAAASYSPALAPARRGFLLAWAGLDADDERRAAYARPIAP